MIAPVMIMTDPQNDRRRPKMTTVSVLTRPEKGFFLSRFPASCFVFLFLNRKEKINLTQILELPGCASLATTFPWRGHCQTCWPEVPSWLHRPLRDPASVRLDNHRLGETVAGIADQRWQTWNLFSESCAKTNQNTINILYTDIRQTSYYSIRHKETWAGHANKDKVHYSRACAVREQHNNHTT